MEFFSYTPAKKLFLAWVNRMVIDIQEDKRQAEIWERSDSEESVSLAEIVQAATNGISYCEDYCASREYTGEHRCFCIRARFPTPAHYEMFLHTRHAYQQYLAAGMLAVAVSETEKD